MSVCVEEGSGPADMTAMKEMTNEMVQNATDPKAGKETDAMVVLCEFQKQNPLVFQGWPEPKLAKNWLSQMENILNFMCITDDQTRVSLAASQLEEDALQWWHLIDRTLTWQEFRDLFVDRYFPLIFRHTLEHDFLMLSQRGITVVEYEAEFSELARYAHELVPNEETRIRRFLRGLKIPLKRRVSLLDLHSYSEALRRALIAEQELDDERNRKREILMQQRGNTQFRGGSAKRQRTSYASEHYTYEPDQRSCFHCGQQGHYRKECTQREATHDFTGDYQSQQSASKQQEKTPVSEKTCYGCGKPGHYRHECRWSGVKRSLS